MRDRITMIIAIVLLAVVAATSYWYSRLLRNTVEIEPPRPGTPDFVVDRVELTQFDAQGRAQRKLFGDQLRHFAENDDIEINAPRLVSLRPDQPRVEVTARRARIENSAERVHLEGNVLVTRAPSADQPQMRIASEYMLALPDLDRYQTNQPVTVTRGTSSIRGNSMEFDNVARTVAITGSVRSVMAARGAR